MTEEIELIDFLGEIAESPPFNDINQLSFFIAREFVNHPLAEPGEYLDEFTALCEKLGLDVDEMITMVAGSLHKVKFPRGVDYAFAVRKALTEPKRFPILYKNKRCTIINIMYALSEIQNHGLFNIPAKQVATSAHTRVEVVYAFIDELLRRGVIEKKKEEDRAKGKGRLFQWVQHPVNGTDAPS